MTDLERRAEELADAIGAAFGLDTGEMHEARFAAGIDAALEHLRDAILSEREQCAAACETMRTVDLGLPRWAARCAAAIRARSKEQADG